MRKKVPVFVPTSLSALARQVQEWARTVIADTTDIRVLNWWMPDKVYWPNIYQFPVFKDMGPMRRIRVKRLSASWNTNSPDGATVSMSRYPANDAVYQVHEDGWGDHADASSDLITPHANEIGEGQWIEIAFYANSDDTSDYVQNVSITIEFEDWSDNK